MKSILEKTTATFAGAIVVLVGCVMAGLGFTVIAFLAMFALAAYGLALIAAPFLAMAQKQAEQSEPQDIDMPSDAQTAA
ncbi:hypothetical protein J7444_01065 [Labrenzia sp. R4_1]|uniref:hypothetical protein n=1 Tax=unclassified Labrenzia TaxID=2648686 RepID=UPI0009264258|nr:MULTISPECIES: hypothetical protein [unclassified Labrenzia]MBO9420197.1 hypothetical protein [Labrenzia sp. R4_2]MBO9423286.1 hypothetical protein [Labrenzia sp. R4_1]OJJ12705.1 hypothetical protein BKI51_01010 [Alphaproteobacteria bacterium AO1-B]